MSNQSRHLDALTGIRGIAAWGVVLYHVRVSLVDILPGWTIAILGKGYLAVDLFFMLSGFVIWLNYAERMAAGGSGEVRQFLWRRFARIWPLHAVILVGFAAFALLLSASGRSTEGYPLAEFPLHILLLQNWGLTPSLTWNHPAWSISTEVAAYFLFPALVMLLAPMKRSVPALLGIAALLALGIYLLFRACNYGVVGEAIPHLGLWRCLAEFSMGAILCLLWQGWKGSPSAASITLLSALAWCVTAWTLSLPETALVPPLFFAGLLALALDRGPVSRLLSKPALRYLGEISYSTYLSHFLFFILFKLAFVDASRQIGWLGLMGFLALVLAASVALYHGVEKPAQRWLGRRPPRLLRALKSVPAE